MSKCSHRHLKYFAIYVGNDECKEFFGIRECVQYNIGDGDITTYLYW